MVAGLKRHVSLSPSPAVHLFCVCIQLISSLSKSHAHMLQVQFHATAPAFWHSATFPLESMALMPHIFPTLRHHPPSSIFLPLFSCHTTLDCLPHSVIRSSVVWIMVHGTLNSGPGTDFLQGWKWFLSFSFIPKAGVKDHPESAPLEICLFLLLGIFFFLHLAYILVNINFQRFGVSKNKSLKLKYIIFC